jgi:hypothetical protein
MGLGRSCKLYRSTIRPTVTHGCETWGLEGTIESKLMVFESKVLRKIFGPTKGRNGTWRIEANDELAKIIRNKNAIN